MPLLLQAQLNKYIGEVKIEFFSKIKFPLNDIDLMEMKNQCPTLRNKIFSFLGRVAVPEKC